MCAFLIKSSLNCCQYWLEAVEWRFTREHGHGGVFIVAVVAAAAVPSAAPPLLINDSIMCINIYAEGIRRQERETGETSNEVALLTPISLLLGVLLIYLSLLLLLLLVHCSDQSWRPPPPFTVHRSPLELVDGAVVLRPLKLNCCACCGSISWVKLGYLRCDLPQVKHTPKRELIDAAVQLIQPPPQWTQCVPDKAQTERRTTTRTTFARFLFFSSSFPFFLFLPA